jgi:hypothetical protein
MPALQHVLSARLDREWRLLRRRPAAVARALGWGVTDVAFDDLDELLALVGYHHPPAADRNDALVRLVEIGQDDDLAARIVLQRVLPGLLAVIARRRRSDDGSFEELIGAAWMAIRACRTERAPQQIAANIVRDAAHRAFVAPRRRMSATEVAVDPKTLDETPYVPRICAGEELATLLADARAGGVAAAHVDLVRDLVAVGSPGRLATARKVTPRTIRNHRDRATANLRQFAAA